MLVLCMDDDEVGGKGDLSSKAVKKPGIAEHRSWGYPTATPRSSDESKLHLGSTDVEVAPLLTPNYWFTTCISISIGSGLKISQAPGASLGVRVQHHGSLFGCLRLSEVRPWVLPLEPSLGYRTQHHAGPFDCSRSVEWK
ncbi:hypothetical protein H920_13757 [Fukomys damarensis]|uniref:Uncharacterized protein n=1 Tax=Fukomys damarensis TaxID=885580 RepID=A0A091D1J2_FUKDA|nr:hypothetical protein H920_13757 [Fukomys damarensis]